MMDFTKEIDEAIQLGLDEFIHFIQRKISENKNYLQQSFWYGQNGSQITVLNYLIEAHQEPREVVQGEKSEGDLTDFIDYVLECSEDKNTGEPLHLAILSGKLQLAFHLLGINRSAIEERDRLSLIALLEQTRKSESEKIIKNRFDLDKRDCKGRTLISLILDLKNLDLLLFILANNVNIHASTLMTDALVAFQPIHQAVVLDSADAIRLLSHQGAQLDNPLGAMKDTPLILAARLGTINAMEALLECPVDKLNIEAENNNLFEDRGNGHTAMEELCSRIASNNNKEEAILGVAMLLCRGAQPPSSEKMRHLLSSNRIELLKAIQQYLENKPSLVDAFVNRCHLKESPLHNIVYADHSWGSSIRHLFGTPSEAAFIVEGLVTRKYDNPKSNPAPLASLTAEELRNEKNHTKLYSEFVRRYTQAYDSQLFTNRWSTMRWMIAEGNCDWNTVKKYAQEHPTSRTRIIYNEMFYPIPKIHEDIEETPMEPVSNSPVINS